MGPRMCKQEHWSPFEMSELIWFFQLDKERQTYGMKETVLGKFYVEALGIAKNSEDAQRLIHWKKPTGGSFFFFQKSFNCKFQPGKKIGVDNMSGDFGTAIYLSLKHRCIAK